MMDVKSLFISTLEPMGYEIILQGSLSDDDVYPESFFTFFNNETYSESFYNNKETRTIWDFDLNFYSNDPEAVNSVLLNATVLLEAAGFIVNGKGYDVISDEPTHTGRGINILFSEREVTQ